MKNSKQCDCPRHQPILVQVVKTPRYLGFACPRELVEKPWLYNNLRQKGIIDEHGNVIAR
ncbi:MAG: hypothetical protein ACXAC5_02070 [Promethearchaeota archaeon]|jgi:hypothetical protein